MSTPIPQNTDQPLVISYLTLRKLIGLLGTFFPFILVLGSVIAADCEDIQPSISAYYHTNMRDIFVAVISSIGLFLFTYQGYDNKDSISCKLAAVFAFGVALFPTAFEGMTNCAIEPIQENKFIDTIHTVSATSFFLVITYICLFLFTKSGSADLSTMKKRRNLIYKACGIIMLVSIIVIAIYLIFLAEKYPALAKMKPVFLFETIALIAFGIAWLTKGQMFMRDQ